jgi:hypothetical protein
VSSEATALAQDKVAWDERTAALKALLTKRRAALKACRRAHAASGGIPTAQELMQRERKRPDYVRSVGRGGLSGIFNSDAGVGFGGPWAANEDKSQESQGGVSEAGPPTPASSLTAGGVSGAGGGGTDPSVDWGLVGSSPNAPVGSNPAAPVGSNPNASVGSNPSAPVGSNPAAKIGSDPGAAVGSIVGALLGSDPNASFGGGG